MFLLLVISLLICLFVYCFGLFMFLNTQISVDELACYKQSMAVTGGHTCSSI